MTAIEIREALEKCYPDVTDVEFSIKHSGFAHEHPLTAIGVLLISSIVLGTTAPAKLAQFTRYSERFVRAVARNMEISGLWANDKYDFSSWYRGELVPPENREFWDHILIGEGSLWERSTDCHLTQYTSRIFGQKNSPNRHRQCSDEHCDCQRLTLLYTSCRRRRGRLRAEEDAPEMQLSPQQTM